MRAAKWIAMKCVTLATLSAITGCATSKPSYTDSSAGSTSASHQCPPYCEIIKDVRSISGQIAEGDMGTYLYDSEGVLWLTPSADAFELPYCEPTF